jgi:acetylornithine/succinyldiaminopimelate/putrescine aminotransferase
VHALAEGLRRLGVETLPDRDRRLEELLLASLDRIQERRDLIVAVRGHGVTAAKVRGQHGEVVVVAEQIGQLVRLVAHL